MTAIPDSTLSWLYAQLTNVGYPSLAVTPSIIRWLTKSQEYTDPRRTYSDVVEALSAYRTLKPRTDIYSRQPNLDPNNKPQLMQESRSLRDWTALAPSAYHWKYTSPVSWRCVQVPHRNLGALCIPARGSDDVCRTFARHARQARTTCQWRWKNLSSILGAMGSTLGRKLIHS